MAEGLTSTYLNMKTMRGEQAVTTLLQVISVSIGPVNCNPVHEIGNS